MSQTKTRGQGKGQGKGRRTPSGRPAGPAAGQAVQVLPAQGGPQSATLAVPDISTVGSRLAGFLSGSPGRLRVAAAIAALACLLLAVVGAAAMQYRANALEDARSHIAQVVRVQKAQADLVRADAAVTNGFLAGGLEPAALTADYDGAVAEAARLLVDASAAQPDDAAKLAQANQLLADYTRQIAQARDNNRLGVPLGSGYLVLGSQTVLRDQLLPLLDGVVTDNGTKIDDAYSASSAATWWFTLGVLVSGGVLVGTQVWLARRTHRVLNVGLVAASAAALLAIGSGAVVLSSTGRTAQDVRVTSYAATSALTTARAAAYSAKGLESLTLVKQGGGAAYETQWKAQAKVIGEALGRARLSGANVGAAPAALQDWTTTHETIRKLDDGGDWPSAVTVATRANGDAAAPADAQGMASNVEFAALVAALDPVLDAQAAKASTDLATPWGALQFVGWGTLVLGILAAIAAVGGISQRLGEYR
ncbi:hypothetical protein [Kineosporia sp. R_H_3]|uniref:hypothetical protein n=1 Tax=Kineosporia sp. R_H_3 TaxID=1961848 RepID=UPI000B4BA636|nr:hypothetical protein [Kineosporia sp. R_H_3]